VLVLGLGFVEMENYPSLRARALVLSPSLFPVLSRVSIPVLALGLALVLALARELA